MLSAVILGAASIAPAAAQAPSGRVCDEASLRARLAAEPSRSAIADGRISLLVPEGMRALTGDEIPAHMRSSEAETLAFGNGEGAAVILMRMPPEDAFPASDLEAPELRELMSGLLELMVPDVQLASEMVTRDGTRWLRIAPRRGATGGGYAAMVMAPFQGSGVMAMFVASAQTGLQAAVRRSAESLEVHDCALPPGARPEPRQAAAAGAGGTCDTAELGARLAAAPRRVAADGGRVSLVPPEEMHVLARAEIEKTFGDNSRELVFAHPDAVATLWFTDDMSMVDMPRYREVLRDALQNRYPDLAWLGHEMVDAGRARWLKIAYTATSRGTPRHYVTYFTAFRGGTLIVDVAAKAAEGPRWAAALAGAMQTIELHDCELPGGDEG